MKTDLEKVKEIAEELMAYQPMIDIPFEQFYQVAIAIVDLGYTKNRRNYNENI